MKPSSNLRFSTWCRENFQGEEKDGIDTAEYVTFREKSNAASAVLGTALKYGTATTNTAESFGNKYDGKKCSTPHVDDKSIEAAFLRSVNRLIAEKATGMADYEAIRDMLFSTDSLESEEKELRQGWKWYPA